MRSDGELLYWDHGGKTLEALQRAVGKASSRRWNKTRTLKHGWHLKEDKGRELAEET